MCGAICSKPKGESIAAEKLKHAADKPEKKIIVENEWES